jgi:hypothetical protein
MPFLKEANIILSRISWTEKFEFYLRMQQKIEQEPKKFL